MPNPTASHLPKTRLHPWLLTLEEAREVWNAAYADHLPIMATVPLGGDHTIPAINIVEWVVSLSNKNPLAMPSLGIMSPFEGERLKKIVAVLDQMIKAYSLDVISLQGTIDEIIFLEKSLKSLGWEVYGNHQKLILLNPQSLRYERALISEGLNWGEDHSKFYVDVVDIRSSKKLRLMELSKRDYNNPWQHDEFKALAADCPDRLLIVAGSFYLPVLHRDGIMVTGMLYSKDGLPKLDRSSTVFYGDQTHYMQPMVATVDPATMKTATSQLSQQWLEENWQKFSEVERKVLSKPELVISDEAENVAAIEKLFPLVMANYFKGHGFVFRIAINARGEKFAVLFAPDESQRQSFEVLVWTGELIKNLPTEERSLVREERCCKGQAIFFEGLKVDIDPVVEKELPVFGVIKKLEREITNKSLEEKMYAWQKIYKALGGKRATVDLINKQGDYVAQKAVIDKEMAKNSDKRLVEAWKLAQKYYSDCRASNVALFKEVYLYDFSHTFFARSKNIAGKSFFRASALAKSEGFRALTPKQIEEAPDNTRTSYIRRALSGR